MLTKLVKAVKHTIDRWTRSLRSYIAGLEPAPLWDRAVVFLGFALVAALVPAAIWAIKEIPRWQVNELIALIAIRDPVRAFELENEARKTLTQIVLGVFGLIVLFFTWRRVRANDRNVRVIEQGHITDRYTKAIEQLGKVEGDNPNIEVRLGAIYALERIAIDSPRDQSTIVEVLSAYVRRNAPWPPALQEGKEEPSGPPRTDVQAILTVLGGRPRGKKREKEGLSIDINGSDLRKSDLGGAHLEGADLRGAHLEGAYLREAHLGGADLEGARLEDAYLEGADLEGASLWRAHLERADLEGAHLQGANLSGANLEGASLWRAHLEGADFGLAILEGEGSRGANLKGARHLTIDQVRSAQNWKHAIYDHDFRQLLGLVDEGIPEHTE